MITLDFGVADLARTRFAISPMSEVVAALRLLRHPDRAGPHLPWLRTVGANLDRAALEPVLALIPTTGYLPDFLTPPATSPIATFADELERVRATPATAVRREIALAYEGRARPALVEELAARPRRGLAKVVAALDAFWRTAVEPHWPRIRAMLDADLAHRARRLVEGGPAALFSDLHPTVRWRGDRLDLATVFDDRVDLGGRGVLIVPSAFYWSSIGPILYPPWQPTLIYPARGVELLWATPAGPVPNALAAVIGASRARLLTLLDAPRSTTDLARRDALSPGAISQHLGALRAAGLATATRNGREVLYLRTELATHLLAGGRRP